MATLSVGLATRENGVEKDLQRIQDLIGLASEEAVAQGREFGLTFYAKEYEFSAWDASDPSNPHWKQLGDDAKPFGPRTFPPDAVVDLEVEGRIVKLAEQKPVVPEEKKGSDKTDGKTQQRRRSMAKNTYQPQVILDSSGEITPAFTLRLRPAIGAHGISPRVAESGKAEQVRDER
jgi:hypothetical protein